MGKRMTTGKALFFWCLLFVFFVSPVNVMAKNGNEGGISGGGGAACTSGVHFCSSWGSVWEWYDYNYNDPSKGVIYNSSTKTTTILGNYNNNDYAKATTISGCASIGGYWRHSLVSHGTSTFSDHSTSMPSGIQVGTLGIGSTNTTWRSKKFSGGNMTYRGSDAQWNKVESIYKSLQKKYPSIYKLGWNGTSGLAWFCGPEELEHTLTAYAVIGHNNDYTKYNYLKTNGTPSGLVPSPPSDAYKVSSTVRHGSSASVTMVEAKGNYEWNKWGGSCGDGSGETANNNNRKCTVNPLNSNNTVYAYYKLKKRTLTAYAVTEYDSSNGKHKYLKTDGSVSGWLASPPSDAYKVSSTVDYGSSANVTVALILGTSNSLYKFNVWGSSCGTADNANRKCTANPLNNNKTVYAYYRLVDPLPCGGGYDGTVCDSAIDINQSRDNSSWSKTALYMKPGEKVWLKGSFDPNYQDQKDKVPQYLKTNSETDWTKNSNKSSILAYQNSRFKPEEWNNAFCIMRNGSPVKQVSGVIGSNDKYYSDDYGYIAKLGTQVKAASKLNACEGSYETPDKISFAYNSAYDLLAQIYNNQKESGEVVSYTPYNFKNSIDLAVSVDKEDTTLDHSNEIGVLAAGESKQFKFRITRKPRQNNVIGGEAYSTSVPYRKWTIKLHYNGVSIEKSMDSDNLRDLVGNTYGEAERKINYFTDVAYEPVVDDADTKITVSIPDLPAGTEICAEVGVWPADSKFDTNWNEDWRNPTHTYEWSWSPKRCFVIAKKPSFQVWGSGIYSNGNVNVPVGIKGHIAGKSSYSPIPLEGYWDGNYTVFGSWTELGLVANGAVKGIASGAGTGYTTNNNGALVADPGGSNEGTKPSYCIRSTLSFANSSCSTNSVGSLSSIQVNTSSDRSSLVSRFNDADSEEYALESYDRDIMVGGLEMAEGTRVIKAENNTITINNNIEYSSGTYTTLESIPKLIIYANNININCNVNRIDAVLIANEDINTCAGITDVNAGGRSNQLIINGVTISNTLTLGRTYGAATGINSIIPAEIINYDSSLFLWANKQSSTTSTGKLTEAYTSELAPRY